MDQQMDTVLAAIPNQKQAQYSTNDQLRVLCVFAHRLGLYDAADFIMQVLAGRDKQPPS